MTGTAPGAPDPSATNPDGTPGTGTLPPSPIYSKVTGTTIPPDQLDPDRTGGRLRACRRPGGFVRGATGTPAVTHHHGRQVDTPGGRRSRRHPPTTGPKATGPKGTG